MTRALVCGAGGFIGSHLVKKLKGEGYWVRGVDLKRPEWSESTADEFMILDLTKKRSCEDAVSINARKAVQFDEVYQLAADMGGMGFIHAEECDIMHNNALMNIHMIDSSAKKGVKRYFFSSSVCVYRDMMPGEAELNEDGAYPALPHNEYGWEKLYSERMAMAYGRRYGIKTRIARFQNCYGQEGTWKGGREKAPAAICRKVAMVQDGGAIEVWGDGAAVRSFTHVDDMIDGIYRLITSDVEGPVNIGRAEYVTIDELADMIIEICGKRVWKIHVDGPVGVRSRNFCNRRISGIDWESQISLREGLSMTYKWIEEQVRKSEEDKQKEAYG